VAIADALSWTRQTAAALAHAHDSGVLHCDLKPANILITAQGAKVVDFGIGRSAFERAVEAGALNGTLPYMAPEQLTERQSSRSSDVYSLGVTLFELLAGQLPFSGNRAELMLRIVGAPTPRVSSVRSGVPEELEDVVACALAKDPEKRYRSARAFEHALAAVEQVEERRARSTASPLSTRIAYALATLAGFVLLIALAGYVATTLFNSPLGRTADFSGESIGAWMYWGFKAVNSATIVILIVAAALVASTWLCGWLASGALLRPVCVATRRHMTERLLRLAPEAEQRARLLLIVEVALLVAFGWYFQDIFQALDSFISQRPPADLTALAPQNQRRHIEFEMSLCVGAALFFVQWARMLWRQARRNDKRAARIAVAGLAITVTSLFAAQMAPFRIIYHNNSERVFYRGQQCYLMGQRSSEGLLFCPLQPPPWSRIVRLDDRSLERDGTIENIFSHLQPRVPAKGSE
jgi:hypothetical protein